MSREEVDIDQFRTAPPKPISPLADEALGAKGEAVDPGSRACLAKRFNGRHFVKSAAAGGAFFDPLADADSRATYEMRQVPEGAYKLYVQYLLSENRSFLRQAGRVV